MILRTLALVALIVIIAAAAITAMAVVAVLLHHVIGWLASDERRACGSVVAMACIALAFVMAQKGDKTP